MATVHLSELLLLLVFVVFLVYRLFSELGKNKHNTTKHQKDYQAGPAEYQTTTSNNKVTTIIEGEAVEEDILFLEKPSVKESQFLKGANHIYPFIVESFASGNLKSIKNFISPTLFKHFETIQKKYEQKGHVLECNVVRIISATITNKIAKLGNLYVTVKFVSEQINVIRDNKGNNIKSNPENFDIITDTWTFKQTIKTKDPSWILERIEPTNNS